MPRMTMLTPLALVAVTTFATPLRAAPEGQVLPELSRRGIGPDDDPRNRRKARSGRGKRDDTRSVRKRARLYLRSKRLKHGGWRFYGAGWTADVRLDGSISFSSRKASWQTRKMQLSFDITDAVMRARNKDPYALVKLRFMRSTAPWRSELRRRWKRKMRRAYFARLPARLRAVWKRTDLTAQRRRALIFELWDECLEPGQTRESRLAQQARWMILRFVRKHLPAGSPHAFTRRELAWMGKRRKGQTPFDPYGPFSLTSAAGGRAPRRAAAGR